MHRFCCKSLPSLAYLPAKCKRVSMARKRIEVSDGDYAALTPYERAVVDAVSKGGSARAREASASPMREALRVAMSTGSRSVRLPDGSVVRLSPAQEGAMKLARRFADTGDVQAMLAVEKVLGGERVEVSGGLALLGEALMGASLPKDGEGS